MLGFEEARYSYAKDVAQSSEGPGFEFSDIFKFAGSAVVDTLVTAADSITLGLFDNDDVDGNGTSQALHWMNEDLGNYFDNHREGVELASFVGGMVLPGMAAGRAMKWAREGTTKFNSYYNKSAKWEVDALEGLRKESPKAAEWKDALGSVKLHTLKQGVAEGMLYEATFAYFNNQHTYMDNNYSVADYAIGAGLGALVGPLRWVGKKKDLFEKAEQIAVTEGKGQIYQTIYPSLTGGDLIAAQSHQHAAIREASAANPERSQGGVDFAATNELQAQLVIGEQIDTMSTPEFKKLGEGIREKKATDGPIDYFTMSPQEHLGAMAISNPETFRGVHEKGGFAIYDSTQRTQANLDAITMRTEDGYTATSGLAARQTLFTIPRGKVGKTKKQLQDEQVKLGIETRIADGVVEIKFGKTPGTEHRQWAGDYLNLSETRELPLRVVGETDGLQIKVKKQHELAAGRLGDVDRMGKMVPESEWLDAERVLDSGQLVIDPWLPGQAIGMVQANAARGLAQSPRVSAGYRPRATMISKMEYKRTKSNVAEKELFWVEGLTAGQNEGVTPSVRYALQSDVQGVGKLQGLLVRYGGDKFPQEIAIGEAKLTSRAEATEYLWNWKQREAELLMDVHGFSMLQTAKSVNLPPETLEAMAHTAFRLPMRGELKVAMYTGKAATYLENKAILLNGKGAAAAKADEVSAIQVLDKLAQQKYHDTVVENVMHTVRVSKGEIKKLFTEVLSGDVMNNVRTHLPQQITNLESKNIIITSRDQMLRHLGLVGQNIITLGKDLSHIQNELVQRHAKMVEPALNAIKHNEVSASQFAIVEQRLSGISSDAGRNMNIQVLDDGTARIGFGKKETLDGVEETEEFLKYKGSDNEIILDKNNADFWDSYLAVSAEKQSMNNGIAKMQGKQETKGQPLWLPNHNLSESFLGFKVSNADPQDIKMITANTADELERQLAAGKKDFGKHFKFYARSDEDLGEYNRYMQYAELNNIQPVNTFSKKRGIEKPLLDGRVSVDNFIKNLRADTIHKMRTMTKLALPDVFDPLETATKVASKEAKASRGFFAQKIQQPVTVSEAIKKTLLNESLIGLTPGMDMANNHVTVAINSAIHRTQKLWSGAKGADGKVHYDKLTEDMKREGIIPAWADFEQFQQVRKTRDNRDLAQHYLAKNQSALVTMNLRFLEFAHAAVTTLSAPVLLAAEAKHVLKGSGSPYAITKLLIDSGKFATGNTDEAKRIMALGEAKGYTKSVISEASDVLADLPRLSSDEISKKYEGFMELMGKPSDWSEEATRQMAFAVGYKLAKGQYPTASEKLLVSSAGAFVSRTMGNYTSRQKPTLFQGTFGQMVGLYQTFMLTMGQNMYRYAEAGDRAAIGQLLAGQTAMFGMESLPFFSEFNTLAGEYASDKNEDMSTAIYNVFGNTEDQTRSRAEFLLYGAPSTLFGAGIYTRAALEPRSPLSISSPSGMAFKPAIFDAAMQATDVAYTTVTDAYKGISTGGGFKDMGHAALQGMAAQSLWRPGARTAELIMGKSFDRKGEIVDQDVWDEPFAVGARILGARPLQEQALRNLRYKASYYNRVDRDRKQKVIKSVRRVVANGEDMGQLDGLMDQYINDYKGTHTGWNTILKTAYTSVGTNYAKRLAEYSEKQPAISAIADGYGQ